MDTVAGAGAVARKGKGDGLWNLFLPEQHAGDYAARFGTHGGRGLTNVDYAPIAETTGRSQLTPYVFNCNAPDSENMEVLLRYGTDEQRARWLEPLLEGWIFSAGIRRASCAGRGTAWQMGSLVCLADEVLAVGVACEDRLLVVPRPAARRGGDGPVTVHVARAPQDRGHR